MALRKRMIRPDIWQDPDFGMLSSLAKLVFIGLISLADDEGKLNGHPIVIGSALFPYRNVEFEEVMQTLIEIEQKLKSVIFYKYKDEMFIWLKNWEKHQTIRADRKVKSIYPDPPAEIDNEKKAIKRGNSCDDIRKQLEEKGILKKKTLI